MIDIDPHTSGLISKFVKGKKNLQLTIGYLSDNNTVINVFGEDGKIINQPSPVYEIGSIIIRKTNHAKM